MNAELAAIVGQVTGRPITLTQVSARGLDLLAARNGRTREAVLAIAVLLTAERESVPAADVHAVDLAEGSDLFCELTKFYRGRRIQDAKHIRLIK